MTLEIRKLNKSQTSDLFNGRGKYLSDINAQPIHFKINNQSNATYYLYDKNITLNQFEIEKLHSSLCLSKLSVFLLAGLYTFVAIVALDNAIDCSKTLNVFGHYTPSPVSTFFVYSVIQATLYAILTPVVFYQQNKKINEYNSDLLEDIMEKCLPPKLIVPSDIDTEFLIFTHAKQSKNSFDVTFTEKITQKPLTFNVTL
ncbi:hypothetical protein BH09DEP1_BH09DEP1_6250 [soil metagenome]